MKVLSKNFLDIRLLIFNELIKKQFHKKREGYMQRLKNHMASPIAAEITDLVDFKDWHIYGNANQDLEKALKPMGATFQS